MKVNNFNAFEKVFKHQTELNLFFNSHRTLISLELDLTNFCDNKCPGCTGMKDINAHLSLEQINKLIIDMKEVGIQSVIISGGGEPTLHPCFSEILYLIKSNGIKIGINTNGLSLTKEKIYAILDCCEYCRFSLDAGTPEMFKKTHGMEAHHFNKIIDNIKTIVKIKKEYNVGIAIGTGYLTNKETKNGILDFVKTSKECNVMFAQMRPFTNDFTTIDDEMKEAKKLETDTFKVTSSQHKYSRFNDTCKRNYKRCLGMFFNTVVTANFKVFNCLHHRQMDKYFLGDLNKQSLKEIWNSARIREVFETIDYKDCPYFCRNDDVNNGLDYINKDVNHKEFL